MSKTKHPPDEPEPKAGHLVYNERQRRWGQVIWDAKKYQFESGDGSRILVWDTHRRGQIDWPLADLSMVANRGDVLWEDPGMAERMAAQEDDRVTKRVEHWS